MSAAEKAPIVLVTGARGQLGQELVNSANTAVNIVGVGRDRLDVTDAEQCMRVTAELQPDAIVHAAAYTAVDAAESEPEAAWKINVDGTRHVAAAAEAVGAKLIYVSTDYVFDGSGVRPYREDDSTSPRTEYGKTKLAGERIAAAICSRLFIVRASWIYGKYGQNFVHTMLKLAETKKELMVVNDQFGSPTYTVDLADFLLQLVQTEQYGTYHASNSGACTWYEFACAILAETGHQDITVNPCTTAQFPRPAPRPAYSVLGHDAVRRAGFSPFRHWRQALQEYLGTVTSP